MKTYEIDIAKVDAIYRGEKGFSENLDLLRAFLNDPASIFLACVHEAGHLIFAQRYNMISTTLTTSSSPEIVRDANGEFSYEIASVKPGYLENNPTITEPVLLQMARVGVAGGVFAAIIAKEWKTVVEWDLVSEEDRKKLGCLWDFNLFGKICLSAYKNNLTLGYIPATQWRDAWREVMAEVLADYTIQAAAKSLAPLVEARLFPQWTVSSENNPDKVPSSIPNLLGKSTP